MDSSLKFSVIIPTLNEASVIEDCLDQFEGELSECQIGEGRSGKGDSSVMDSGNNDSSNYNTGDADSGQSFSSELSQANATEVIVVDAGSEDNTGTIVQARPRVRLLERQAKGRAVQMNAGASVSTGNVLVFLHADTRLPDCWKERVAESIIQRGMAGGRFRFDIAHSDRIYRWIAKGTNFRSRVLGITYGDQALYATRDTFQRIGGYPEIPIFEDAGFANMLKKTGDLDWIDEPVLTSARRWERRGPIRTILLTWLMRSLYTLSVSPRFLSRFYGVVR